MASSTVSRKSAAGVLKKKLESLVRDAAERMDEKTLLKTAKEANQIVDEARARASRRKGA
jgi:hypothetical protein